MEVATYYMILLHHYLLKVEKFQHLFFLMEVATHQMVIGVGRDPMFQHLFFLMEVATNQFLNTCNGNLLFQHLFFLMEVATTCNDMPFLGQYH